MKRITLAVAAAMFAAVIGAGVAAAEPAKNQVTVPAMCDDGKRHTFVLNDEGNSGHVLQSTSNVITVWYEVTYVDPDGDPMATDSFDRGNKAGLEGAMISCHGETTLDHWQLGTVKAVFDFGGFVTPQGKG